MTDEPSAAPGEPEPAAASAAPPAAAEPAPAPAPVPAAPSAKSPWPVLLPVLVGVGALLVGGILGGTAGFALGHHFQGGPVAEFRMPDHQRDGDRRSPQDGQQGQNGNDGRSGPFDRGSLVSGTISGISGGKLTIELPNGDTQTLNVATDTPVVEANASSVANLANGDHVTVVVHRDGNGDPEALLIRTGDGSLSELVPQSR